MNKDYLTRVAKGGYDGGVDSIFSVSGDTMLPMSKRICFGSFTKSFQSHKKCDITVRLFHEVKPDTKFFGVTPFELDEIIEYLNDLKKIFPFEFSIKETTCSSQCPGGIEAYVPFNSKKLNCYDITYSIDGPHIQYMFILTMQRFLYARFDCYYLAVAMKIKHEFEEFKKMNLFNILNCVISTISPSSRGGDMFHFDAEHFCYLWSSPVLRDYLLQREEKAKDERAYGTNGVADLYSCMIYCNDSRLQRSPFSNTDIFQFYGIVPGTEGSDYFKKTISMIISNLTILREYNGYSDLGKKRVAKIESMSKFVDSNSVNFYLENNDRGGDLYKAPETKFDESLLEEE